MGLRGIEERVRKMGGSLTVESSPKTGTKLTVTVPIDSVHKKIGITRCCS